MTTELTSRERFLQLMKYDILKLDLADLDFGIYRILNRRREVIDAFFDKELPGALDAALEGEDSESELSESEEDRLYNHLYTFFSRYYRDGDFEPQQRRARDARYSVPYSGEDVHFHWRSRGSYYVKTTEELKSYAYREGQWRVRFELVEAYQEPDNVQGSSRYFIPVPDDCRVESAVGDEFVVPLEFRRLTGAENSKYGRQGEVEGDSTQERIVRDLSDDIGVPESLSKAELVRHLVRYARKSRSDYFIHPDLGEFLRGELDFYLKNEFLDVEAMTDAAAAAALIRKMHATRDVAWRIIQMLDEIESFQARLFEKRKFVLANNYLVPIHLVPEGLWDAVLDNGEQLASWQNDFGLPKTPDRDWLANHPTAVVDTSHLGPEFRCKLLESLDDVEAQVDGILVASENFAALRTLLPSHRSTVTTVYIDPPYNTGNDGFLYRDDFSRHSAWASLIAPRLALGRALLHDRGSLWVSIDDHEHSNLKQLADHALGETNHITSVVWEGGLKNDSRYVSVGHDYIVGYLADAEAAAASGVRWRTRKEGIDDIYAAVEAFTEQHGSAWDLVSRDLREWYGAVGKRHPAYAHRHYGWVDKRGVYFAGDASWPGGGGPRYEVLHPITNRPVRVPATGWRLSSPERMQEMIADDRVHFGADETSVPNIKRYLHETEGQVLPSVFYRDRRAALQELRAIMGSDAFSNPKDVLTISKLLEATAADGGWAADFFAGSGTTGHAAITLRRDLGLDLRFILVEMGEYFDSVLKRRIVKIMYAPEWRDGEPRADPAFNPSDTPEWVERSPRLVQVIHLEAFESSLDGLVRDDQDQLSAENQIRYVIPNSLDDAAAMLSTQRLETPFDYQLATMTEEGERFVNVDLITTFNLIAGIKMRRYRELDDQGRRYVVVDGEQNDQRVLVVWRSVAQLDPEHERSFLVKALAESLDASFADYDRIWHNADAAVPGGMSLDAEFKRLMFEPDPALQP